MSNITGICASGLFLQRTCPKFLVSVHVWICFLGLDSTDLWRVRREILVAVPYLILSELHVLLYSSRKREKSSCQYSQRLPIQSAQRPATTATWLVSSSCVVGRCVRHWSPPAARGLGGALWVGMMVSNCHHEPLLTRSAVCAQHQHRVPALAHPM